MKVTLIDYANNKKEFDIGDIDNIYFADMEVISGDEVLTVKYKNGKSRVFDSCDTPRIENYYDDSYDVYMPGVTDLFHNETWLNRTSSYDCEWRGW